MKYISKGQAKGTLFCIHGNSSSAKVFNSLLASKHLPYTKVAIELNGHGNNQNVNDTLDDFTFESQKKLIISELAEIDEDVLLIGHSLGGHLAIEVASEEEKVKGLVIMGTPPVKYPINFAEAFNPIETLNVYFEENPQENQLVAAMDILLSDGSKASAIIDDFLQANPLVRTAVAWDIMQNKLADEYTIFTMLNVPKFVIVGDSDPTLSRKYLEVVKKSSQNQCEIIEIANCGHFPSVDQPDKFVRIITRVADGVLKGEDIY